MAILVAGTVAFDTVTTPEGEGRDLLGGSATHFSVAASFFSPVRLVAVVGEDFHEEHGRPLVERNVALDGLVRAPGKTFRWSGAYGDDLNNPATLETQLNVLTGFDPKVPPNWSDSSVVFLANVDPVLQERVLDQVEAPELVAADTMNYWIASKPAELRRVLERVDVLLINDAEIRQLTTRRNLIEAAETVMGWGPRVVVVKRGEHGVLLVDDGRVFAIPAFPLRRVVDPTGAGDAFAGGFLGWTAARIEHGAPDWRRAAVMGSVMASFQVEAFSLDRVRRLRDDEIRERYGAFLDLVRVAPLEE